MVTSQTVGGLAGYCVDAFNTFRDECRGHKIDISKVSKHISKFSGQNLEILQCSFDWKTFVGANHWSYSQFRLHQARSCQSSPSLRSLQPNRRQREKRHLVRRRATSQLAPPSCANSKAENSHGMRSKQNIEQFNSDSSNFLKKRIWITLSYRAS